MHMNDDTYSLLFYSHSLQHITDSGATVFDIGLWA